MRRKIGRPTFVNNSATIHQAVSGGVWRICFNPLTLACHTALAFEFFQVEDSLIHLMQFGNALTRPHAIVGFCMTADSKAFSGLHACTSNSLECLRRVNLGGEKD